MSHLLRLSLTPQGGDGPERIDNDAVKVSIVNASRGLELARVDVKPDGQPHDIALKGPANTGEVLEASGNFSVGGERASFTRTCRID